MGVWVAQAPSGEVTYANPEFRKILGMDAVPASRITDAPSTYGIFDRQGRVYPVDQLPLSRVVSTGRAATVDDLVIHRPDGHKVNVRAVGYPRFDNEGRVSHVVIAFSDITAEVKAELERDETQSRLALAVNYAPIVVWAADTKGVVTLSEGAGLKPLGVESGQLVGQNLFELYKDHPTIPGYIRRGLAGESFGYSVRLDKVVYDTWLTPLRDAAGTVVGVAGLSHDVSEIRALQAKAIQDDRAVAVGTLAASVAHEINNPLTYMLGHLELLREVMGKIHRAIDTLPEPIRLHYQSLEAQILRTIEPVRTGTERIANITRELRTFNRPITRETSLVDVRSVVDSVLKLVRKEIEARGRLELMLQNTAPVIGDSTRLVQVILNLTVNAMQALSGVSPGSDGIWIRTGNEGSVVVIEVADSGPGVPPDDRERIFDPFVTTKGVGEGTGLGLFVCRNIVRDFSGTISVRDRAGGGAVFRVELPVATLSGVAEAGSRSAPAPAPAAVSGHVLIIEDEWLVADLIARQLDQAGYRTSVELDPRRAIEVLATSGDAYDLVYCDLMMKATSGMDVAEALSVRAPAQLRKIVFMTGGAFTPRAVAFRTRHQAQFVDKPFDVPGETARRLSHLRQH